MDKSLNVKLRNYFSDRIKEIKEGSYVPTYEQIKELPEFSGINRETFRIARKSWYLQHFGMSSGKFAERLENIKAGYNSENKFVARLETIKAEYISEEEYDKEQIKGSRKSGFCILTLGLLCILWSISMGVGTNWYGGYWFIPMILALFLIALGTILIIYNTIKGKRNKALMVIIIGVIIAIPGVLLIFWGLIITIITLFTGFPLIMQGTFLLIIGIVMILNSRKKLVKFKTT